MRVSSGLQTDATTPSNHRWPIMRIGLSREVIASLSPRTPHPKRVHGPNTVGALEFLAASRALVITPGGSGYGNEEQGRERLVFANALRESGCLFAASLTCARKR